MWFVKSRSDAAHRGIEDDLAFLIGLGHLSQVRYSFLIIESISATQGCCSFFRVSFDAQIFKFIFIFLRRVLLCSLDSPELTVSLLPQPPADKCHQAQLAHFLRIT